MKKINVQGTNLYDKEKKDRCKVRDIRATKRRDIIKSLSSLYKSLNKNCDLYRIFLIKFS